MAKERVLSVTLADCDVQTKRGHGAGGQNRNKRDTAVKIVHRDSGAVGESQEQRTQGQNKKTAFRRMAATKEFKTWLDKQMGRITLAEIEVSESMRDRNIKTEVRVDGEWTETDIPSPYWWQR